MGLLVLLIVMLLVLLYPCLYQLRRYYRLQFRGFWVTREGRDSIVYEERREGTTQRLTIDGELMTYGHPFVIYVPDEEQWNKEMPEWALGRRVEILQNIKRALGTKNYEYLLS